MRAVFSKKLFQTVFLPLIAVFVVNITPTNTLATEKPEEIRQDARVDEKLDNQLNLELQFSDQEGQTKPLRDFFLPERPLIIAPVYYGCPRLCTLTLNGVVELLNQFDLKLGEDFNILAISINDLETPKIARNKAEVYFTELKDRSGVEKGWKFLTGKKAEITELMDGIGFRYKEDRGEYSHIPILAIISPKGHVSRYFYGISYSPKDMRFSLVEASRGKIGTTIDKVLLYCFRFDSIHGRYSLAVMNVVRALGITASLGIFGILFGLRLREKGKIDAGLDAGTG